MRRKHSTSFKKPEPLTLRKGALPFYRFSALEIPHAVFTRRGGVSEGPYATLNLSFEVGDDPERVKENRRRIKEGLACRYLVSAKQVHGAEVFLARGLEEDLEVEGYDALITDQPGVGLLIKQADCQALILYEPERKALGLIHAGWRGLVRGVIPRTIRALRESFGVSPERLRAFISPSLQPCCAEFRDWERLFPEEFARFRLPGNHFDLPAISRHLLLKEGLEPENIFVSRLCTRCREEFFSYRREKRSGRFGTLAYLP
ncbi:MAG: peptidoglycan editing factor PgeF [Thermodesulfobacteria bacterium]|nr:peptidoglycan editing factor PgeF [Thermodesulfobacteriota bacterium]